MAKEITPLSRAKGSGTFFAVGRKGPFYYPQRASAGQLQSHTPEETAALPSNSRILHCQGFHH